MKIKNLGRSNRIYIKAICWTESNLLGLYSSLKVTGLLGQDISLEIFLSKKIKKRANKIIDLLSDLKIFDEIKVNKVKGIYGYLTLLSIEDYLDIFFKKKIFSYFLPTPMNPPSIFFLPGNIYFYGDGFGSLPKQDYQWFPKLYNIKLKSLFRYFFLKYLNLISTKFFRIKNQLIDISLDNLFIEEKIDNKKLTNIISTYLNIFSSENIKRINKIFNYYNSVYNSNAIFNLIILSNLSPSRVEKAKEFLLYKDFFKGIKNVSDENVFIIKFHPHQTKKYRLKFIDFFENIGFKIINLDSNMPVEVILLNLINNFPEYSINLYSFQESSIKINRILSNSETNFKFHFGFPNELINTYFRRSEIIKRKQYQINFIKGLKNKNIS